MPKEKEESKLSAWKRFVFILIPLLFFYIFCEISSFLYLKYRFREFGFNLETQGNTTMVESSYQIWQHPPNYTTWSGLTHFNNYAFRRFEDISIKKAKDVVRVFIMGGSTAFGSQAMPGSIFMKISGQGEYSSNETISAWMEKLLNKKYPNKKFEVINGAVNWTNLHQQMLHYLRRIRSFQPDLIISIDGQNDSSLELTPSFINVWDAADDLCKKELFSNIKHELRPIFRKSHLAYLLAMLLFRTKTVEVDQSIVEKYSKIKKADDYQKPIDDYYQKNASIVNKSVSEYIHTMKYFSNIMRMDKVRHLFILQPLTHLDKVKPLTKRERAIQGYLFSRPEHHYFRDNFYKGIVKKALEIRKNSKLPFWDFQDVFRNINYDAYVDYCHFSPEGNKAFAEKLIKLTQTVYPSLFR